MSNKKVLEEISGKTVKHIKDHNGKVVIEFNDGSSLNLTAGCRNLMIGYTDTVEALSDK